MSRLTYAKRVARKLEGTPLLVPSRRVWGTADPGRVPAVESVGAAVGSPRAKAAGRPPHSVPEVRSTTDADRPEPFLEMAAPSPAAEVAQSEASPVAPAAAAVTPAPETVTPAASRSIASPPTSDAVRAVETAPRIGSSAEIAPQAESAAAVSVPVRHSPDVDASSTPVKRSDWQRMPDDGREADEPRVSSVADAIAPESEPVQKAERQFATSAQPPLPATPSTFAPQQRAPIQHVQRAKPAAASTAPAPEPSLTIGTIEVHVAPPAPAPAAPRGAARSASSERLARGFVSTFGLRQG